MRLVLLCGWYFPDSLGGTEVYVHSLAKDLMSHGIDVMVAAPSLNEQKQDYVYDGVRVHRYPIATNPTLNELNGHPPQYLDSFVKWLAELSPDVVHVHSLTRGCGFWHIQSAKSLGVPLVFTLHMPGPVCLRGTMMRWGKVPCDGEMRTYRCTACLLEAKGLPRVLGWPAAALGSVRTSAWAGQLHRRLGSLLLSSTHTANQQGRARSVLQMADRTVVVCGWLKNVVERNGLEMT